MIWFDLLQIAPRTNIDLITCITITPHRNYEDDHQYNIMIVMTMRDRVAAADPKDCSKFTVCLTD